jgi:hypothetical protein
MACDWERPRLVRHACNFALSAGDCVLIGVVEGGASEETACLCRA